MPWLVHAFGTRRRFVQAGDSECGRRRVIQGAAERNESVNIEDPLLRQIGAGDFALARLLQVHSASVFQVSRAAAGVLDYRQSGLAKSENFSFPSKARSDASDAPRGTPGASGVQPPEVREPVFERPIPASQPRQVPEGDALMTAEPGILLSIRTADCMPILLVDPERKAVAAVHAGWRGALAGILEATVAEIRRAYLSRPDTMIAVIGPSIRACCYAVGDEVANAFRGRFAPSVGSGFFCQPPPGATPILLPSLASSASHGGVMQIVHSPEKISSVHLDLLAVGRHQLLSAGLRPSHIHAANLCTACRTDLFYSYRKEGKLAGRMMSVIGIKPSSQRAIEPSAQRRRR